MMMHEREEEAVIEISAHRKNTENATNDKFYTKNHIQQILYRKIQKILLMVFLLLLYRKSLLFFIVMLFVI